MIPISFIGLEKFKNFDIKTRRAESLPHRLLLEVTIEYPEEIALPEWVSGVKIINLYILKDKIAQLCVRGKSTRTVGLKLCNYNWRGDTPQNSLIRFVSLPLSLEDVYELDKATQTEKIQIELYYEGLALAYMGNQLTLMHVRCRALSEISRMDFVKKVIEPADLLKRTFLEVVLEEVDPNLLDKIRDPDIREGLRILLSRQKTLNDALRKLHTATTVTEFKGILADVRATIEKMLTDPNDPVAKALKKAYKVIPIAEPVDPDALDSLVCELVSENSTCRPRNIALKRLVQGLFYFTSKFLHTETEDRKKYNPRPEREEAEFAVQLCLFLMNYFIKLLRKAAAYTG